MRSIGIAEHDHRLAGQKLGKAGRRGEIGLEIGRLLVEAAAAGSGPRGRRQAQALVDARRLGRRRRPVELEGVVDFGAEIARQRVGVGFERLGRPVARLGRRRRRLRLRLAASRRRVEDRQLVGALQQRIALQFGLDERGELGVGHLQQLDRLQKLRRQHHRLALPHRQSVRQRHPQPPLFDCRPRPPPRRGVLFAYTTRWRAKRQVPPRFPLHC